MKLKYAYTDKHKTKQKQWLFSRLSLHYLSSPLPLIPFPFPFSPNPCYTYSNLLQDSLTKILILNRPTCVCYAVSMHWGSPPFLFHFSCLIIYNAPSNGKRTWFTLSTDRPVLLRAAIYRLGPSPKRLTPLLKITKGS